MKVVLQIVLGVLYGATIIGAIYIAYGMGWLRAHMAFMALCDHEISDNLDTNNTQSLQIAVAQRVAVLKASDNMKKYRQPWATLPQPRPTMDLPTIKLVN